ncbi:MAG: methyl-accepting chemotaxis protein [Planctomycetes bacterium]|nr:methyl-accepting chemotaxis protein [Planctomycetota bacterium]
MRDVKKAQIEQFFAERKGDMGVLMETVNTLRKEAFAKLTAVQTIKKNQIEGYFSERLGDISVLSTNETVKEALRAFDVAFKGESKRTGGEVWTEAESIYGPWLTQYNNEYGYYDLFLIAADGDVLYTVAKESDLGANLINGNLKRSPLGKCFRNALNGVAIQDFEPYAPSNGEPCAFVGAPITKDGRTIGVVALQLPLGAINKIMQERAGLGKTGECYLVGFDKLMRSDSFLDPTGHSVKASFAGTVAQNGCDTEGSRNALSGRSDADVILDYNGNPVLSAYSPLDIKGLHWAILAEIDVAEAFCPVDENGNEFFAKYVEMYGYYDLFLMNGDGYCFYTVAKESDYQTNLVSGKFSTSGLGKLTRRVLQSKNFGLEDFEPYAPSNGEPCAFIAQPVVHNGNTDLIVALQLSLDAINGIMQQRDGMGRTGETYLVGQDKLMRSDSFLDPTGHSVKASFAGTVDRNGCDTEAATEALSGRTDAKIIMDYNGNPVLSAFTPVNVGGITWALLAEIDEAEAFEARNAIVWMMSVVSIIAVAAIVGLALFITRSITVPISRIIEGLTEGSEQVASASSQVSSASQSLAEGATEQAAGLEETSSSLEEMASMTKQNADNAQQANTLASEARKAANTGSEAMAKMNTAIQEIQKSSDETAKIIKVIDEIAFQTNLLALNAAVEAARAGEAGKGFAVVAEEVRNLAMRSAEAAKNTSAMIEESVKNSKNGVDIASEVGKVLEDIVQGIGKTTDLVGEIAAASAEQSQGIDQVNTAVNQMDKVTQQNAANAEESASASEELSAQAESMTQVVGDLIALVSGSSAQDTSAQTSVRHTTVHHAAPVTTQGQTWGKSDHVLHTIAEGGRQTQKVTARTSPEKVIPLDDKDNFSEFNT